MAGWHNGLFYLRDVDDNFRLYVQGRAQIDSYNYLGPGVTDTTLSPPLKSTLFLRRIRPEVSGEILRVWSFMIAGDWGSNTPVDNAAGTNETRAANPGVAPTATSGRYAGAQTVAIRAQPTDVFVNFGPIKEFNIQVGQYDAPFTIENRTSDKYLQFMERSLAVRDLGIPTNKEIGVMLWGEPDNKLVHYSIGVFNGDGQNRPNLDNRFDVFSRVFAHPLALGGGPLKDAQIGASLHYGVRDPQYVAYDYPSMTTQAGYAFWTPVYAADAGGTNRPVHVIPSGRQLGLAGELRIPIEIFDLTSEFVWVRNNTREAIDGLQATTTERLGDLKGWSYYVQVGVWPLGNLDINGHPGYENISHVDFKKPDPVEPKQALQLLVKWEQLHVDYESASRGGVADPKAIDGVTKVNALSFGANYWFTKHLRLSADWITDFFPGSNGPTPADQRAKAPGNTVDKGIYPNRDDAHVLYELTFRVAVAL